MKNAAFSGFLLKRILVVLIPPILIGLVVFMVFDLLQAAYTSEAQLQVNEALWLDFADSTAAQVETHPRVVRTMTEMRDDAPYQFLAYALILHDFDSVTNPFGRRVDSLFPAAFQLTTLIDTLRWRLAFQVPMGHSRVDSLIEELFRATTYWPHRLKANVVINQIPGTSLIRMEADSRTPEMSTFVVNTFAQEFINYRQKIERKRLERIREDLFERVAHQKDQLAQHQASLAAEEAAISTRIDDNTWELKRRIIRLEAAKNRELRRIAKLERSLARTDKQPKQIVRTNHQNLDPVELSLELESSQNRLAVIQQQLQTVQEQLKIHQNARLEPLSQRLRVQQAAYEKLTARYQQIERALVNVDQLLIQVVKGKTRHPIPYSAIFIGTQAGITSFLLWLLFLIQIRYIRWTNPTGHTSSPTNLHGDE